MNKKLIDITQIEKPFKSLLSFDTLIDQLDTMANNGSKVEKELAKSVLSGLEYREDLKTGIDEFDDLSKYQKDIESLMSLLFPFPLIKNEIKIAVAPMSPKVLKSSDRFHTIFGENKEFVLHEIKCIEKDEFYINICTFILQTQYGIDFKAKVSPVYDVVDKTGITKYFKSAYNADFLSMRCIGERPKISPEMQTQLEKDYFNIDLWKSIFPPNSWECRGFGIISFTDVSSEEALSRIKNNLIGTKSADRRDEFEREMNDNLSSLLEVPNVKSCFTLYDSVKKGFVNSPNSSNSYVMKNLDFSPNEDTFCDYAKGLIFEENKSFVMSNLDTRSEETFDVPVYASLRKQGAKSFIITPIYDGDILLGILEFISKTPGVFTSKHLFKIDKMLTLSTIAIKKYADELATEKSVIIQNEFTSIHSSVAWKFMEEAENYIDAQAKGEEYNFDNILFHNLTALYGQMDISGSSRARNKGIAADLKSQMTQVRKIIKSICMKVDMPLLQSIQYQITIIYEKLSSDLAAGMEQEVVEFLRSTINPLFEQMRHRDTELEELIADYFTHVEDGMDIIYDKRKDYDNSVKLINMHLSSRLDQAQLEAQKIFPHYFERYKTDGVDHNIFIGQEISPNIPYHKLYLENLRLWQLKTIFELEIEHFEKKKSLPLPLDVASLVMVYSNPLAIKYRMDEKQFDVDGAYNARYEIIKKRIDKAHIRDTNERITQPGKVVIIYTQPGDLEEYTNYINFLTYDGYIKGDPEFFEIEQLEGVVGLRGIRVAVNFEREKEVEELVSSEKLIPSKN